LPTPTTVEPSAEAAHAMLLKLPPGRSPSPIIPPPLVQRNASKLPSPLLMPATVEPSPETPLATLKKLAPGRSPSPTIPPPLVQRNAWEPDAPTLVPTTVEPSADTSEALLTTVPPGRSPSRMNIGTPAAPAQTSEESRDTAPRTTIRSECVRSHRCVLIRLPPRVTGARHTEPGDPWRSSDSCRSSREARVKGF
jgi:hypothetical protein